MSSMSFSMQKSLHHNHNTANYKRTRRPNRICWTILLVDSTPYSPQRVTLELEGHSVVHILDAELALALLSDSQHPYDIVLINMDCTAFNADLVLQKIHSLFHNRIPHDANSLLHPDRQLFGSSPRTIAFLSSTDVPHSPSTPPNGAHASITGEFTYSSFVNSLINRADSFSPSQPGRAPLHPPTHSNMSSIGGKMVSSIHNNSGLAFRPSSEFSHDNTNNNVNINNNFFHELKNKPFMNLSYANDVQFGSAMDSLNAQFHDMIFAQP